jgi:hypothetical protein
MSIKSIAAKLFANYIYKQTQGLGNQAVVNKLFSINSRQRKLLPLVKTTVLIKTFADFAASSG